MGQMIRVGIADWKLCNVPDQITTIGLGSCVGVVLYTNTSTVCGLLHVLLPSSQEINSKEMNRAKFADTGLADIVSGLERRGISRRILQAKIAGGATMFQFGSDNSAGGIGVRNVAAVKQVLMSMGIPVVAEDTGKDYGRTIIFDPETKKLIVRSAGKADVFI